MAEVRLIGGRGVKGLGYFDNEASFLSACQEANGTANVYVGIQPRPFHFLDQASNCIKPLSDGGKDGDIEWLSSIVFDLDPIRDRDTASTNEELDLAMKAASRVADHMATKGFHRPLINMSGNGAHLWIALPPSQILDVNRAEITGRLKALETRVRQIVLCPETEGRIKVDSIYNLSRIIKVIGTLSVKGKNVAHRPHRLSRSVSDFKRQEDPALFDALMTWRVETDTKAGTVMTRLDAPWAGLKIPDALTPTVHALISSSPSIRKFFDGKGKLPLGADGRPLDQSSSGYDFSLALALARKGVTELSELVSAILLRPDGVAREKGLRHAWRTAENAIKALEDQQKIKGTLSMITSAAPSNYSDIDFKVSRVVIKQAMPPIFELTIDGKPVRMLVADLHNPKAFVLRYMETLHRIPQMPGKKSAVSWREHVNMWLANAEIVDLGPDANDDAAMLGMIRHTIDGLPEAGSLSDLDGARVLFHEKGRAFRKDPIFWLIQEKFPKSSITSGMLCDAFKQLKCSSFVLSFEGQVRRAWVAPKEWPADPADQLAPEDLQSSL